MLNCLYINIELGVSLKKKYNSRQNPNPSRLRVHDIGDLLSSMNITRISQLNSPGLNTQSQCGVIDYPEVQGSLQGIQTELHSLLKSQPRV